jgi:hypothetical protein
VLNRLIKEVKEYTKAPVSDIKLQVNEENFTDLRAEISGPGARSIIAAGHPKTLSLLSTHLLLPDMPYLSRKLSAAVLLCLSAPLPFTSLTPDVSTEACMLRSLRAPNPHAPISWPAPPSLPPSPRHFRATCCLFALLTAYNTALTLCSRDSLPWRVLQNEAGLWTRLSVGASQGLFYHSHFPSQRTFRFSYVFVCVCVCECLYLP